MSADELRQAADTLRERIGCATNDAEFWTARSIVGWACDGSFSTEQDEQDAVYIATMHPGVGLALADWLHHIASVTAAGHPVAFVDDAINVARLINGGAA